MITATLPFLGHPDGFGGESWSDSLFHGQFNDPIMLIVSVPTMSLFLPYLPDK